MKALTLTKTKYPLEMLEQNAIEPNAGQVIVEVYAAALNRRDYWITQGLYPGIKPPVILGSDGAGVVVRCGEHVDEQWLGKEVILNPGIAWGESEAVQEKSFSILGLPVDGTFANEVSVSVNQLFPKPKHLSWGEAAALPLAGVTAYRALFSRGKLTPDDQVLITGIGGGVASMALLMAKATGARVWVTSSSNEKIEKAVALGAAGGFNYREEGWKDLVNEQNASPSLIIDGSGGKGFASLVDIAKPGGRIISYGSTAGVPEGLDLFKVFWKQLTIAGSTMGSPNDFEKMLTFVTEKEIVPIVDREIPFDTGNSEIEALGKSNQFGKIVLQIRQ